MAEYHITSNPTECRVSLAADLTATQVPGLRTALKTELDRGAQEVVFDLKNTEMLDSSGIGLLIATYNSIHRQKGSIRVVNASPDILHLLQTMRLVTRLKATGRTE
jgi:anti-anti-sigma factor